MIPPEVPDRKTSPGSPRAPEAEAELREALKRCSAPTYEAACHFRQTGDIRCVATIVRGVIECHVEPDLRPRLDHTARALRLCEDLGLDSLTMIEIVLLAEEVLGISISHQELRQLRTVGDVQQFIERKLAGLSTPAAPYGAMEASQ